MEASLDQLRYMIGPWVRNAKRGFSQATQVKRLDVARTQRKENLMDLNNSSLVLKDCYTRVSGTVTIQLCLFMVSVEMFTSKYVGMDLLNIGILHRGHMCWARLSTFQVPNVHKMSII